MSKIGQKAIEIPTSVVLEITKQNIVIKGKEGQLIIDVPKEISLIKKDNILTLKRSSENKKVKSVHGLFRQLIYNAVVGVDKPWIKRLEVVGTGFNVKLQGEDLIFRVGYSHMVFFKKIINIKYQVEGNNKVVVSGVDKQLVGQTAYQIKILKKPDAYKGKGIRYEGEKLRIKPGKKAKAAGAPA
jgi:large subunit ribosomal protein L6